MTPPDGVPPDALRELVREVLRDILPALANGAAPGDALAPPHGVAPGDALAPPHGVAPGNALAPPHEVARPGVPPAPPSGVPPASSPAHPVTPVTRAASAAAHLVTPASRASSATAQLPSPAPARHAGPGVAAPGNGSGLQPVRLATDEELHAFVLRVLALADNPKRRRDLVAGRLRFTLASPGLGVLRPADTAPATPAPAGRAPATSAHAGRALAAQAPAGGAPVTVSSGHHRIEKGAVTERAVQAAAAAGERLVLGPRAVLTPLARDRARALGVPIEKER
jgi:hypothetical protein